jgi:hypothetical protein
MSHQLWLSCLPQNVKTVKRVLEKWEQLDKSQKIKAHENRDGKQRTDLSNLQDLNQNTC